MATVSKEVDVEIDFDPAEYLDEVSVFDLIEEVESRGYTVLDGEESEDDGKCPTDHFKDEYIAQAYNELDWYEWRDMIESALAKKKGGKK